MAESKMTVKERMTALAEGKSLYRNGCVSFFDDAGNYIQFNCKYEDWFCIPTSNDEDCEIWDGDIEALKKRYREFKDKRSKIINRKPNGLPSNKP